MVVAHGLLDQTVVRTIWTLVEIENAEMAACLFNFVRDFEAKIQLFSQLFLMRFKGDKPAKARIKEIIDELNTTNRIRNHLTHNLSGSYSLSPFSIAASKPKPRAEQFVLRNFFYTVKDVNNLSQRMMVIRGKIERLRWEIAASNLGQAFAGMPQELPLRSRPANPSPST
jgi:hypothetical protein